MRILIADLFSESAVADLASFGCEVTYDPKLTAANLPLAVVGIDVLIVRSTKVTAACIAAANRLSVIVRAGAGVNTIDVEAASNRGIYVCNCPGKNSVAVAELAIGLLIAVDRRIPANNADFHAGHWNKGRYSEASGLAETPIGLVGMGQIGVEMAFRANALAMRVFGWSRSLTPERATELKIGYCATVDEMIARCRVISLHCALTPQTRGLINRERIERMRPGTILINTARAELVDEQALVDALRSGHLRAGLDVIENEPEGKDGNFESRLQGLENVVVTHHIGASTDQAQAAIAAEAMRIVKVYLATGKVVNWVNQSVASPARCQLVVRHYDRPGVLANVLAEIKKAEINAEEIENVVFEGHRTACCTIRLGGEPQESVLNAIRARTQEVISAELFTI